MADAGYLTADELAELRRGSALRGAASLVWTWGWIAACMALYIAQPGVITALIGIVIISGRHLALAVLMHEAAHRLLLPSARWNDRIGRWLTAYPIMTSLDVYRSIHLKHHRANWTDDDPDLSLATALPVTPRSFARKMLRDLTGVTAYARYRFIVRLSAGLTGDGRGLEGVPLTTAVRRFVRSQYGFLITNAVMLGALTVAGHPEAYLLLWVVPAFTGYNVVLRIRSIAEHACISEPSDPLRNTRTTLAPGWLGFLMAPHNVNYHLEHHLYVSVPHYNLPRVHRLLKERGALEGAEIASGYGEVLRRAIRPGQGGGPDQPTGYGYA